MVEAEKQREGIAFMAAIEYKHSVNIVVCVGGSSGSASCNILKPVYAGVDGDGSMCSITS